MKNIILDFDNTMGVRGCDVDDGLALLYLLGNPERCRVLAACTTYGNAGIDVVDANTRALFEKLGLNIPVYRGAAGPGRHRHRGGALPRRGVRGRTRRDIGPRHGIDDEPRRRGRPRRGVFPKRRRFHAHGRHHGKPRHQRAHHGRAELLLRCGCHLRAARLGAPVTIATAQNCLPAHVTRERLSEAFTDDAWLMGAIDYWFADMGERYAWDGFAVWDQVAAAALIKPELFANEPLLVALNPRLLFAGYLERRCPGRRRPSCPRPSSRTRPPTSPMPSPAGSAAWRDARP